MSNGFFYSFLKFKKFFWGKCGLIANLLIGWKMESQISRKAVKLELIGGNMERSYG